jgi:hypothetical protein
MTRLSLFLAIALVAGAPMAARSQTMSIAWNDCRLDGGQNFVQWACDTNATNPLRAAVVSFNLYSGMSEFIGVEATVEIWPADAYPYSMPDWWSSTCRPEAFSMSADSSTLSHVHCRPAVSPPYDVLVWTGEGVISLVIASRGDPIDLAANQEYIAMVFRFTGARSHGAGACAGCGTPVCLLLSRLSVCGLQNIVDFERVSSQSQVIGWQCARGTVGHSGLGTPILTSCSADGTPCATPVRNRTWGEIKSLYR